MLQSPPSAHVQPGAVRSYFGTPLTLTEGPNPAVFTALTFTVILMPLLPRIVTDVDRVGFQA